MEKLLQWAVNNSDTQELKNSAEAIRRGDQTVDSKKFDPAIIEAILGKDDATRMKEALECVMDPKETLENKEIALDNFELLIEHIDNAKNIENMKLWPSLLEQLDSKDPVVRKNIAWICGTAVQNCPEAQQAFLKHQGLAQLLKLLKEDADTEVRRKAQFAISGVLKHSPEAQEDFIEQGGPEVYTDILERMDDNTVVRKIVFSLNILIMENKQLGAKLLDHGFVAKLDKILVKYTEEKDEDMVEKTLRTLLTFVEQVQSASVPSNMKEHIQAARNSFSSEEALVLTAEEWKTLLK